MIRPETISLLLFAAACGGSGVEAPPPVVQTYSIGAAPPPSAALSARAAASITPAPEATPMNMAPAAGALGVTARTGEEELGGVEGGVIGGTVGGVVGGSAAQPPAPIHGPGGVIPFGAGMSRPKKISGRVPNYPQEARAANVEGMVVVRCIIAVDGAVSGCQVLRSLPLLDQEVLSALQSQRYTPVIVEGRAVAVSYNFSFRFRLQ